MSQQYGPFLAFRGIEEGSWNCSAIVVAAGAPVVSTGGKLINPEKLWQVGALSVFRYLLEFPMAEVALIGHYQVGDIIYDVAVPAIGLAPRIAYVSCNGFSSLKLKKSTKNHNAVWQKLLAKHGAVSETFDAVQNTVAPYNILAMGGDQVYADSMWELVPSLAAWSSKSWDVGNKLKFTSAMRTDLEKFYFNLYVESWSQPEIATIMASVPSVAMWDDHDLIDGWGSYPIERQECQVFQGIWRIASKAFAVFQQHLLPSNDRRPGSFCESLMIGGKLRLRRLNEMVGLVLVM